MKIGIYNPYFDSFGGGERYVLTLAEHWSKTHDVSLFWNEPSLTQAAQERFDLDLSRVHVVPNIFASGGILGKIIATKRYDLIFFLSDGSIPTSFARHNILHFQVPFHHISIAPWKVHEYQKIVCNSAFTEKYLDPRLPIARTVIYPPVDTEKFSCVKKTKTILTVGRFSALYGAKKHEELIVAFKEIMKNKYFADWKLIIAGGVMPSDVSYFEKMQLAASGLPVEFRPNCSFNELVALYSTSSIYWHAAGLGETKPEHMEHFGITTVEAMASCCLPIVFDGGGQPEIITDGTNGYLWKTPKELIEKTVLAIRKTQTTKKMIRDASKSADRFSKNEFVRAVDDLLKKVCG
jgi:glycosyltransferase involved in cell wall biosynthesis